MKYEKPIVKKIEIEAEYQFLWSSEPLPGGAH